jgi:very-short-patch-repair endonuclease
VVIRRERGCGRRLQGDDAGVDIADFVAPSVKLVVEVDGGYHAERVRADARRDRELGRLGYRVLRVSAELVVRDIERAQELVRAALSA